MFIRSCRRPFLIWMATQQYFVREARTVRIGHANVKRVLRIHAARYTNTSGNNKKQKHSVGYIDSGVRHKFCSVYTHTTSVYTNRMEPNWMKHSAYYVYAVLVIGRLCANVVLFASSAFINFTLVIIYHFDTRFSSIHIVLFDLCVNSSIFMLEYNSICPICLVCLVGKYSTPREPVPEYRFRTVGKYARCFTSHVSCSPMYDRAATWPQLGSVYWNVVCHQPPAGKMRFKYLFGSRWRSRRARMHTLVLAGAPFVTLPYYVSNFSGFIVRLVRQTLLVLYIYNIVLYVYWLFLLFFLNIFRFFSSFAFEFVTTRSSETKREQFSGHRREY